MANRTAVVTGAASGMGRLMTTRLTRAGWTVAAVDLPGSGLESIGATTGATPLPCDVTDNDEVTATAADIAGRLGPIGRLVNAAGIAVPGTVADLSMEAFARSIDVNYLGTVRWVKALLPEMQSRRSGQIVLFASLAGWMPTPSMAAYTATKFAVVGFAETLAMEVGNSDIAVRCVCPGAVRTPMLDDIMSKGMPDRLKNLSRAAAPELVIDAIEASLRGRHRGIYVFPGAPTKVLWRARRFSPTLLAKVVQNLSSDR